MNSLSADDAEMIRRTVTQVLREYEAPRSITLPEAVNLIKQIEEKAQSMGFAAVIAVADRAARPIAIHCMDDAYIASFDIALHKAYTSAALKMSTAHLAALARPDGPLYGIQHTNEGKIVIIGGGEILEQNGQLIGALGVSGGTLAQDTALAVYGREVFNRP